MAISKNISRDDILKAIEEIDKTGVPPGREGLRYFLEYNKKNYPVKYLISLANKYSSKVELERSLFNTYQAQFFLQNLNFKIVDLKNSKWEQNTGFKLISLRLKNNHFLGTIDYNFLNQKDLQKSIYTTVIIGPNGTGKSNLFRIIIELFKELFDLSQNKSRSYNVTGQFELLYSFEKNVYNYSNFTDDDFDDSEEKLNAFLLRNGTSIDFHECKLPKTIVANSIMLTDKYPVYTSDDIFPIYKYLGVRNRPQNASTRSYVRKTVEFIVNEFDSSAFRRALTNTTRFLGLSNAVEIFYNTSNTPIFFWGKLTPQKLKDYFDPIQERYKDTLSYAPFKLNNYLKISNDKNALKEICDFCNDLVENNRLVKIPKSSIKKIKFNIINEESFQQLKSDFELLEKLRQLGMISTPEIQLRRDTDYSLQESSSGEYHFFSSVVGFMATIKPDSLIFIDEPEISLHPNWQIQYLSFIRELFSSKEFSSSHILIATHSHFLISDLEGENSKIIGLKRADEKIESVYFPENLNTYGWSAEDVLYNVFNVRSTWNSFLEADLTELLGMISNNTKDQKSVRKIEEIIQKLDKLPVRQNDPLQEIIVEAKDYLTTLK